MAATAPAAAATSTAGHAAGHFLAPKAGMQHVDRAHVARVTEEASRGSRYYENAQKREAQLMVKIDAMKRAVAATSPATLAAHAASMDAWAAKAEAERCFTRVCVVVDMDAFYAAVEERDDSTLAGVAFAVGGIGMISTASYAARAFGVRSAMPGFIGIKLCPHLRFVPCNFAKYEAASQEARGVFKEYDAAMHAGSLDEAYLDVTANIVSRGIAAPAAAASAAASSTVKLAAPLSASQAAAVAGIVAEMRGRVTSATRCLTCSAGIAPNFMLAKIASNDNKPNGQTVVPWDREGVLAFLRGRSVRAIPGVGKVTEKVLTELGIHTIGEIISQRGRVRAAFNERMSQWLLRCALGINEQDVHGFGDTAGDDGDVGRKSISHERTFGDCSDRTVLLAMCAQLAASVAEEMAQERICGKTVSIRMKLATFEVRQRSVTLPRAVHTAHDIATAASDLLRAEFPLCLRLLGVRVSSLASTETKQGALDTFVIRGSTPSDAVATHTVRPPEPATRNLKRGSLDMFFVPKVQKRAAGTMQEVIVISDSDDDAPAVQAAEVVDCTSDAPVPAGADASDDLRQLEDMLSQELSEQFDA